MLNPSAYALGANRSCIRDLFEYGCQRAAVVGRENVYDYSLGNPSIPSPKEVDETVRQILDDTDSLLIHGYTSAVGDYATRKAISDDLNARYGVSTVPEEFFIGCGAAPELVSVFRALAVPGAEILAVAPYFPEYKPFAQEAGLEFKVVPADIPSFQINLTAMEQMITPSTQAVILNSPNNPSGVVYTRETYQALAEILNSKAAEYGHPIYIVSDEPYRELAYGVEVPFLPEIYRDTVICYSYSKSLSLPGERIGYVYVPQKATDGKALYSAVAGAARAGGHVCAPSLWQKVIARCAHLRPDLESYDRNPQGAVRRADPDGLRNGEARRRVLSVHQSSRRRRQRIFRRGEEERPAGRPRRRLRLPGIFPHLLLRESEDDSEEPAGVRGTDSLRRVVKYFPYYDGNGSGDS